MAREQHILVVPNTLPEAEVNALFNAELHCAIWSKPGIFEPYVLTELVEE